MRQKPFFRQLLILFTLASLVAGCSGTKNIPIDALSSQRITSPKTAEHLLAEAAAAHFPQNIALKLQASELLMVTDKKRAKILLDSIDYDSLPENLKVTLALSQARIADSTEKNADVFNWLDREAIINSSDPNTVAFAHILRARAYNRYTEYAASLDEWLAAMPLLTPEQQKNYESGFWQTLLRVPLDRLQSLEHEIPSGAIKGWLELAILYQPGNNPSEQLVGFQRWLQQWPGHPGSAYVPGNLEQLLTAAPPQRIALLLPLSGSLAIAGQSIRDGIIAAHYQALHNGEKTPELLIYDTGSDDVAHLADKAIAAGAQLIIGPLSKDNVSRIQTDISARVPVLALNYLDNQTVTTGTQLYQFGLSTEDEARIVAHRATLDGHKRAMVMTPDSSWGKKVASAFEQAWVQSGGEIAITSAFNQETAFSKLSAQLLQINQSQQREKQLSKLLGESLGFRARRRQDIDMIFIAASSGDARQIKPALAYQFAGDIPVYGTSSVFSGTTDAVQDRDINGIRLPVMPWSVPGYASPLEKNIIQAWPQAKGTYGTLYALGADAYQLYPKLQQLSNLPGSQIKGLTGWLSISADHRVDRQLVWQIFENGQMVPLPVKQPYKQNANLAITKNKA